MDVVRFVKTVLLCLIVAITPVVKCDALGAVPVGRRAPAFTAGRPVWHRGHATTMNEQLVFRGVFMANADATAILKLVSSNPYRVRINGAFAWYGPARGPKGYFRVDEVPLEARVGENVLEIECAGYYCQNFYFQKQPSFIQAELELNGSPALVTSETPGNGVLEAFPSARVRKVSRYSHARAFGEAYELPAPEAAAIPLEERSDVRLLPRRVPAPDFSVADDFIPSAAGPCVYDGTCHTRNIGFVDDAGGRMEGYPKSELDYNLFDSQQRFSLAMENVPAKAFRYRLADGRGIFFEAPLNRTGFPALTVRCLRPGEVYVLFDEYPILGSFNPARSHIANAIVWKFTKPGNYEIEAFEPYVLKAFLVVAKGGAFEISSPRLRLYRNADSRKAVLRSSDPELDRLFAASEENYAQNSVDGFMDCPGRERACWNCDAYFTARASLLLSGGLSQETLFLENFALPTHFDDIDRGMIPMCYPADFPDGNYIPSWALFFTLQLEEYMRLRRGDRYLVGLLRPRIFALVDFFAKYRNADGLLENLPRWVFVEWSKANDFVQDVNYPNNMLYAAMLDAVDRLYGRPDLAAEAEKVREMIRRQSWTGEWFCDNAVRQADGSLRLSGECTETCQYYAFYFGTATKNRYPELYRRLTTRFGPERTKVGAYPKVWSSAPFIGNLMRLDWLGREGCVARQLAEIKGYFSHMVAKTGTIWENANSAENGSCCHGFASHVSVFVIRDVIGVKGIDTDARTVALVPPKNISLDFCSLTLPVGNETLEIGWRKTGSTSHPECHLPAGWRIKIEDDAVSGLHLNMVK